MNISRIQEKNDRELSRLTKEQKKPTVAGYLLIMTGILSLVRMLDEFVTSAPTSVQSNIVEEFFVQGMGIEFDAGLATLSLITTALLLCSVLAVFFVALCDKIGRKKILIICTIGMTAGMLVCALSSSLIVHIIGRALITFFVATDVHQIYIMEIAPVDKRAFYTQITTVFGSIGVMLVGVVRLMYTSEGALNWRGVFTLPGILGIVAVIGIALFARETNVFLDARIAYLQKPVQQRKREAEAAKKERTAQETVSGILPAARYVFTHKQTLAVFLSSVPISFATIAFATYYETIMTTSGMSTDSVSTALIVYPLIQAVIALIVGYIMDKAGRKAAGAITSVCALAGLILFIWTAEHSGNPIVVGILLGVTLGAYWRYNEVLTITLKESVPTAIRASAGSITGLASVILSLISGVVISIALATMPVGKVCIIFGSIFLGVSLMIYLVFVKETKGVVLDEIQ